MSSEIPKPEVGCSDREKRGSDPQKAEHLEVTCATDQRICNWVNGWIQGNNVGMSLEVVGVVFRLA